MAASPKFDILSSTFIMLCISLACAERDFNFNDSQNSILEPKDEPTNRFNQDPYAAEVARCHYTESEIVLSLVLRKQDWSDLSDNKKSKVLYKLSKFFAIPKEFIVMESVTKRDMYEMQKQSIRKGNNKCRTNRRLGRLDLMIGCGPKYLSMGEPIANQIGQQMRDGSIDSISGQKFGWWIIWRKSPKIRAQRGRRQIEGSGEDDYDDESYDYDGDDEEENVEPVTEIPTTTTHAHRHHHGSSTPNLTETSSNELTNNNNNNNSNNSVEPIAGNSLLKNKTATSKNNNNNNSNYINSSSTLLPAVKNIDEEIVESVSQLESVITKTIENTKHIEELSVPSVDDDDENSVVVEENNEEEKEAEEEGAIELKGTKATDELMTRVKNMSALQESNESIKEEMLEDLNGLAAIVNESKMAILLTSEQAATATKSPTTISTQQTLNNNTHTLSSSTSSNVPSSSSPSSPSTTSSGVVVVSSMFPPSSLSTTTTSVLSPSSSSSSSLPATVQSKDDDYDDDGILPENHQEYNASHAVGSTTAATPNVDVSPLIPLVLTTTNIATTTTTVAPIIEMSTSASNGASTDYIETRIENTPPMIKTRLQKFAVTSGKYFSYVVPANTFNDIEDLTNLRLELSDKDGHELKTNSWLQFNAETHEIYGLPLDDAVSKWQYRLSATDSGNLSVTETLEMSVQQHRGVRSVNHEINIAVKINEKNMPNIDWQIKLIRAIAATLGDESSAHLVVREIRQTPQDPAAASFSYFNETLPTSGECPDAALNAIIQRLDVNRLLDLIAPTLSIKSITGQLIGPCQKQKQPHQHHHITDQQKEKPKMHTIKNLPPVPRNQVDRVNATVGHLLVFKVPSDTFYDPNDENALTLSLKTKDNREISARHWLQFDSKNQEFYGIPKSGDIGSEEYLLVATDSGGLTAADALVVVVSHAPKREFSVYFKAYLAIRHEQFNADLQRKFVERLTQLFNDHSTQFIQIRSVTTHHDADGTIVNFYNTSLHKTHNRCPEEEIEATRNVYLMQDYKLRERVRQAMGPDLNLTNMQVIPLGACHPQPNVIHHDNIPTKTAEPTLKSTFADNYMFTFIIPAIIIVTLILVASIIACCLHRRRMSGKMELGDEEERKSFRPKGIPVIFQDELDEKPEIGNKSPIILKDEKPPLLPPSYNTSNMNAENDVDEYVPPPAVVMGGREVRGKSPATPSYRKPPPYVSP